MPVPREDVVCRFIREGDWSKAEERPKASGFKQNGLSLWHLERLRSCNAQLEDLQFDSLEGSGQALLTVDQIFDAARMAGQKTTGTLHIAVEWRPETVEEAWNQWREAHIEVEATPEDEPTETQGGLMSAFRMGLCTMAECIAPPDSD